MNCPKCKTKMAESNITFDDCEALFKQEYFCFKCSTLYECTSQSGDMVEEYLEYVNQIGWI